MSLAQIEKEIANLTPEELDRLQAAIEAQRNTAKAAATPEMLEERRQLMAEVLSGEWSADLPAWQETRMFDKQKTEERWES